MGTSAFLDTNIWVHFRPPQDIDWLGLLAEAKVELLVPPIVIDELDKLKDQGPTRRVQNRARGALKMIEEAETTETRIIRPGVSCRVLHDVGPLDFHGLRLSNSRADDILIATMCAFRLANPSSRLVLITGDIGPRLKARRVHLEVATLPDTDRINEADPLEVENQRLQREVQRLTSRRPSLTVRIANGQGEGARLEVPALAPPPLAREDHVLAALELAHRLAPEQQRPPEVVERNAAKLTKTGSLDLSMLSTPFDGISAQEFARYDGERAIYFAGVEKWAREEWGMLEESGRCVRVTFELVNDGTDVAEDVDALLHIPDGPEVREWEEPSPLDAPVPPDPPRKMSDSIRAGLFGHLAPPFDLGRLHDFRLPGPPPNVSTPTITKSHSYDIEYHVQRLKHNTRERLGDLLLIYPNITVARGLTIGWQLRCASLPDVVTGSVHLVLGR